MLAITQPLRVGDWVTFEEHYGVVEDVRLTYTFLRTSPSSGGDPERAARRRDPAQRHARSDAIGLDISVWLPPAADIERALAALQEETGSEVSVAEVTPDGVRLTVGGDPVPPPRRARGRPSCARGA